MKYIYIACLSIGCAFFVLRSVNNQYYPKRLQQTIQPTLSNSIIIDDPKTTVIQQEVLEQRTLTTYNDDMTESIQQLIHNTVLIHEAKTAPGTTPHQGLLISNDGLVLIPDQSSLNIAGETITVTTSDQKLYTGTIISLSSPYLDLVQLNIDDQILDSNTKFNSVLSVPKLGESVVGVQLDEYTYALASAIMSNSGTRYRLQDNLSGTNMFAATLDGHILGMGLPDSSILPLTTEYIENIINIYSQESDAATITGSTIYSPQTGGTITTYGIAGNSLLPISLSGSISHINHQIRGRETAEDILGKNGDIVPAGSLITHIDDIAISRRSDPNRYSILLHEEGHILGVMIDGQRKNIEREALSKK